ncbi:MAG: thioredoxin domain-containing protein, partial [Gammaproteobacteria bacterium]|nr:thioredoxin domain-containing protein [Gammaproteobacteria bacterium]
IPHFEKMLYDNGLLLTLYSQTWQITGEPLYQKVTTGTADWVIEEMQSPEGGYYYSLDADSEGIEGKFYAWEKEEVSALLNAEEFAVFAKYFGLDQGPNFEGKWHLRVMKESADEATLAIIEHAKAKF